MPDVVEVVRSERPQVGHLVRRFFGALSTAAPSVEDAAWADAMLTGPERAAFAEMANHDRRHAIGVARRALDRKSTRLNSSHIPLSRMPSSA